MDKQHDKTRNEPGTTLEAHFAAWSSPVQNRSLNARLTKSTFDRLVNLIPSNVSPNLITLAGLCSLAHAWHVISKYSSAHPTICAVFAVLQVAIFYVTNSLDGRHGVVINQSSPVNELFKYASDCLSTVFLTLVTCYCLGVTEWHTQWYSVQTGQLILFTKHLSAFHRHAGLRYNILTGPGEVLTFVMVMLTTRATLGLEWFTSLYAITLHRFVSHFDVSVPSIADDPEAMGAEIVKTAYYSMYILALLKCLVLPREHWWSRFGIAASLLMRLWPAILLHFGLPFSASEPLDVVSDGFFMAILSADVALAKMAGREIHPMVVLMSFASLLSHTFIFGLCSVYYIAVFGDLCHHMNLPLLTVCRNVYCDGVYDLCHIGHKNLFKRALGYGNRLFVGVCGDKDCASYKRPPIMTHDERCAEVAACKSVTKVIENAPCFGITQEFLDLHQIHVVAFGQEYQERWPDPNDDPYYGYVRKIGIARPMPRTQGLSTSDLIKRIQKAAPAEQKKSPT